MRKGLLFLASLMMLLVSCRKDTEEITITNNGFEPPVVEITGSILGLVLDENNQPLPNATVRIGDERSITNEAGIYRFDDTRLNARGTYITVDVAGYFHGSKRIYPGPNTTTSVDIQLLPINIVGTVNAATGGQVNFEGAQIELPANGVVDAQNRTYRGDVQIAAHWLNPTANNLDRIMPGNLEGIAADGSVVGMATFGMLAVELLSENGEELQVAPAQKATLTFPVPGEIASLAPADIPLWHFDETLGLWVEEGQASLQNGNYVGEVSHFSFWNCDIPYPLITLSGRLVNELGKPVGGTTISISADGIGRTGYGISAEDGTFSGLVPADAVLQIIVTNACSEEVVLTTTVGPFTTNTDIGDLVIEDASLVTITGRVVDCMGEGIADASLRLSWANLYVALSSGEDGNFSYEAFVCEDSEMTIKAYDLVALNETEPTTLPVNTDTNFGNLAACDNPILEFIENNFNGETTLFVDPIIAENDSANVTLYHISAHHRQDTSSFSNIIFLLPSLDLGSYSENFFYSGNNTMGSFRFTCVNPSCTSINVTITRNDGPGGYLQGNYSGTISGYRNHPPQELVTDEPINGSFSVLIE